MISHPAPGRNLYIQSIAPRDDPVTEQLREELRASRNQIDALIKRNAELASASSERHPSVRKNVMNFMASPSKLLTIITLICIFTQSSALTPQVCMPHSPESYLKLPAPVDCAGTHRKSASEPTIRIQYSIYGDNTITYESNGTLCKIINSITRYSVNAFGVRYQERVSTKKSVTIAECKRMRDFRKCENGDLLEHEGFFQTKNPHIIDWPSPPLSIFWETQKVESTNCFMMNTKVSARYGEVTPISAAGSMANCKFSKGECQPKEGAAFIWTPQPKQECRYVFYKTLNGFQTDKYCKQYL
uniref:Uncharacterized protein n=1 Tax=Caenorhabditis japonica TaxID=281687 RepID=A0A8R1ETQ5_CAEJA